MNEIIATILVIVFTPLIGVVTICYCIYARISGKEKVEQKLSKMYLPKRDKDKLRELPPTEALKVIKNLSDWKDTI
jgi:hypothetical protein